MLKIILFGAPLAVLYKLTERREKALKEGRQTGFYKLLSFGRDWNFVRKISAGIFVFDLVVSILLGSWPGFGVWFFMFHAGWLLYTYYRYKENPVHSVEPYVPGTGTYVFETDNGLLGIDNPFRGIFISGGAGSGKSKSLIEPIIHQTIDKAYTGLIYDFKFPTLANEVYGRYEDAYKVGITPYFVNFSDLSRSHRINPLTPPLIATASHAIEASRTLFANIDFKASQKRDFWILSAEALLAGCIWYLKRNYPQNCTLPHAVAMILNSDPEALIGCLERDEESAAMIASIRSGKNSENQLAGVFATCQNYLTSIFTPEIVWVLSGDQVPVDINSKETPSFLTIGNDPTLSDTYSPLIALIMTTTLKRINQQGRLSCAVILDEAPTIYIPNFQNIPATGRSNWIATVYAVQDIAQVEGKMGKDNAAMLISNLGSQFYGRTTNPDTAKRISTMFGQEWQVKVSTSFSSSSGSGGSGSSSSTSYNEQLVDRLPADRALSFGTGQFAAFVAEGNVSKAFRQFIGQPSRAVELPAFQDSATPENIAYQFALIKSHAAQIVQGPTEAEIQAAVKAKSASKKLPWAK